MGAFKRWQEGADVARYIDHTLLKPGVVAADIAKLCEEAAQHRFYSVCVNGAWVAMCREQLRATDVQVSAVCGFPLGANVARAKAFEAAAAVEDGASEIDMVLAVGALLGGEHAAAEADIAAVVKAVAGGGAIVKVIFETGLLDEAQITLACRISEAAGAHYVKTSTGFGPGGATEAHIRLMRAAVPVAMGVKASGGIRDYAAALQMLRAGASRLGTSAGVAIATAAGEGHSVSSTAAGNIAGGPTASTEY